MYLHICVCVYVYMYACVCIYRYIYIHVSIHTYINFTGERREMQLKQGNWEDILVGKGGLNLDFCFCRLLSKCHAFAII